MLEPFAEPGGVEDQPVNRSFPCFKASGHPRMWMSCEQSFQDTKSKGLDLGLSLVGWFGCPTFQWEFPGFLKKGRKGGR